MPIMKGVDAIEAIRREFPRAKIVVLTGSGADEDIYRCFRAGVQSYLWKSMSRDELLKAISTVYAGVFTLPSSTRLKPCVNKKRTLSKVMSSTATFGS